jgi:UDP-N-acetylmuramyl pentapeptide phosphotransferase/UDP-N-acetylglucosamine-1-phosphate transferase
LREALPFLIAIALGCSAMLTYAVRSFALSRRLLDRPNQRSSHVRPTPRLGGLAVIATFVPVATAIAWILGASSQTYVVIAATAAISIVGVVDDLRPLPASIRFVAQIGAGAAVLGLAGQQALTSLGLLGSSMPAWMVVFGLVIWLAWATNLYNFMDGLDGLAGGQSVVAGVAVAACAFLLGAPITGWIALALAACAAGFLVFNFPPASIFMGDVGSTAIGFFLAATPFLGEAQPVPLHVPMAAMALFVLDATWTLTRRLLAGERVFEAHRTHFYQRAAIVAKSHLPVTVIAYAGMIIAGAAAVHSLRNLRAALAVCLACFFVFAASIAVMEHSQAKTIGAGTKEAAAEPTPAVSESAFD